MNRRHSLHACLLLTIGLILFAPSASATVSGISSVIHRPVAATIHEISILSALNQAPIRPTPTGRTHAVSRVEARNPAHRAKLGSDSWNFQHLYRHLIKPLARLSLFVAIGLFIGNLIEALQWTHYLGRITRPFLRWGHLSDHSAVAFMAAFFSGVTANTMLVNAYQDGHLTRRELYFSNLVNTLPSYFLHLPTTFFILLPLVRTAGLFYLLVTFSAALVRTLIILIISRLVLPKPAASYAAPEHVRPSGSLGRKTWEKFQRRLRRILIWTVPIYTLFFFINELGFFKSMQHLLASHLSIHILPVGAVSVIAFQVMTEFTAGAAAAGALLDAGTLTIKQTVLALLFGNVISSPVRALRHQLPYYMGIFTPRLGMPLLLVSQIVRLSSIAVAMFLFYWIFPA